MSHTPFRFLHASDLHLERPLAGVTDVPDELREIFLEAPYRAATRLIDAALAEQVDFVVLAGDVLDASLSGPRGPIFLCEQFQRLKHAGIAVYWAGGDIDAPARWPAELALPDNVRRFSIDRAEQIVHHRGGLPLCHVLGQSNRGRKFSPADFHATPGGLLNIAVVYGQANAALAGHHGIAYWALGGTHRSATRPTARQIAHYPGTPQGRRPQESGSHGATLVEVLTDGRLQTRRIYCDVVRWHTLEVRVDEHTSRDQLEELLRDRLREHSREEPAHDLLISFNLVGHGPLWQSLRRGRLADELFSMLQAFARRHWDRNGNSSSHQAWTVAVTAQTPAYDADVAPDQQTLLGDYLRLVHHHQSHTDELLDLKSCLHRPTAEVPAALWRLDDAAARQQVLLQAAALGVELLHGDGEVCLGQT